MSAQLVHEGAMGWDSPIANPLPAHKLRDLAGAQKVTVRDILQFHRQRGSRGFASAAAHIASQLKVYGLTDVEVLHFPTDGKIMYGSQRSRMGWDADKGVLTEVRDGKETVVADACLGEGREASEQLRHRHRNHSGCRSKIARGRDCLQLPPRPPEARCERQCQRLRDDS